jgi:SAM-dependent methyltransferase
VKATRSSSGKSWTPRTVAWYERADAGSDYAARVLAAAAPVLAGCESALDVGAGFGALALPLAARLSCVTALEPSPAMRRALRVRLRERRIANVRVVPAAWGERPLPAHDLVLCAHVGPLLGRGASFLAAADALARRAVVLVRDAPGGDDKFFFPELYPLLLGCDYTRSCGNAETLAGLADLGIVPTVRTVSYRSDQPFDSLEEACDFWMAYMRLAGDGPRRFLRQFLRRRLERARRGWIARYRKTAAVIMWRSTG